MSEASAEPVSPPLGHDPWVEPRLPVWRIARRVVWVYLLVWLLLILVQVPLLLLLGGGVPRLSVGLPLAGLAALFVFAADSQVLVRRAWRLPYLGLLGLGAWAVAAFPAFWVKAVQVLGVRGAWAQLFGLPSELSQNARQVWLLGIALWLPCVVLAWAEAPRPPSEAHLRVSRRVRAAWAASAWLVFWLARFSAGRAQVPPNPADLPGALALNLVLAAGFGFLCAPFLYAALGCVRFLLWWEEELALVRRQPEGPALAGTREESP